jgi:hypothetical protein
MSQKAKKDIKTIIPFSITTFTSLNTLYSYKHLH